MLNFSSTGASSCSRPTFISFDSAFSHEIAVVDLEDRLAARLEDAAALVHQPLRIRGVLDDAVGVDEVKGLSANGRRSPSATSNRPASPCCAKLARARSIADAARSTPVTSAPPLANRARSTPAPQPTSRTDRPR